MHCYDKELSNNVLCNSVNISSQHVNDNTREDAVLDLIFSSEPGMIDNLEVREKFGEGFETYSDHRIITYD